jgi:hypothetical protein
MKYDIDMETGGIIYVPSFINIGSVVGGDTHTDSRAPRHKARVSHKPTISGLRTK